ENPSDLRTTRITARDENVFSVYRLTVAGTKPLESATQPPANPAAARASSVLASPIATGKAQTQIGRSAGLDAPHTQRAGSVPRLTPTAVRGARRVARAKTGLRAPPL